MNMLVMHSLSLGWIFCLIQYNRSISEGHRCRGRLLTLIPPLRIGRNGIMPWSGRRNLEEYFIWTVLKVRFPSQSTERTRSTESVEYPTAALLGDEISRESCQHDDELQGHPASPCLRPSLPSNVQFSTDEDSATVRQGNHDLPGPFDLILN
jgi:hypothetical protein